MEPSLKTSGVDELSPAELAALARHQALTPASSLNAAGPQAHLDTLTEREREALVELQQPSRATWRRLESTLKKRLAKSLEKLKNKPAVPELPKPNYRGPRVRMAFDAEWVTRPKRGGGFYNEILCITCVTECGGRQSRYIFYPKGPDRSDRPTMARFFHRALLTAMREGIVASMPDRIDIFGHFMRGDLAAFNDFWAHKREFQGLGKTLVSGRLGHVLELDEPDPVDDAVDGSDGDVDRPMAHTEQLKLRDTHGRRFRVSVRFIDTTKLTPGQTKSLSYLGALHGLPKLDLHDDLGVPRIAARERPECEGEGLPARYGKDRMDLVMRDYPDAFEKYAFRDCEVTLIHAIAMCDLATTEFGLDHLPNTIAACARAVVRNLSGGNDELQQLVGRETRTTETFNRQQRKFRRTKTSEPTTGQATYFHSALLSYHGGRNECYYHGPTADRTWFDYDLPGAYSTALVGLRAVDWDNMRVVYDPAQFGIDVAGYAWITFEFPEGTRFPCLLVRSGSCLIYPLVGRRDDAIWATSPEIFLARSMGARVEIIQGFIAPWKSDYRIFGEFTKLVQEKRKQYPKQTHPFKNALWKEVGNSAYGQLGQGLKDKRVFDPATMGSKPMGPSPLTEPLLASWTTGFIRAVLGEILAGLPSSATVLTATTDGLLVDIPIEQMKLDGPLCSYFADLQERMFGVRVVLEPKPKHMARQLISVCTRSTFTARAHPEGDLVCAKGGVKAPAGLDNVAENQHMLRLYLRQFPGMQTTHETLISARQQLLSESDLVAVERTMRVNMRYDFKRRPVNPRMVPIGRHSERVAWDTVPWRTVEDAAFARVRVDAWCTDRDRVFKTMDDFFDWQEYHAASRAMAQACGANGKNALQIRKDNAWGVLQRLFLQAARQGAWGIHVKQRGMMDVVKVFNAAGFETCKDDVTYAARRKAPLIEHCVAWTPMTARLLGVIRAAFPDFEYERAFRVQDHAAIAAHLQSLDA